tara:strand:+ start:1955 stop:3472 length:1518 start_codon:yes stop_codon:yes gene_type:complete
MSKKTILEVKNLKISSKKNYLIHDLSFKVNHKEILGIVGESGSGKSLTALSIIDLIKHKGLKQEGEIIFNRSIIKTDNNEPWKAKKNEIAIIFQDPASYLNPSMKCGDQIIECIIGDKDKVNEATNLLKKVVIDDPMACLNKYPHELSGGQQQRVMIAMALAKKPKILIADEATSSLDTIIKKEIINLIIKLKYELESSLIIVTHNLNLIKSISDRIILVREGKICETSSTKSFFKNPKTEYGKKLIKNSKVKFSSSTSTKNNEILSVENIQLDIGSSNILDKINFVLKEKESIGIIGESGSGKSSISKCIIGYYKNYRGVIRYKGVNIKHYTRRLLSKEVQLIFQDPYSSLDPKIRIINHIQQVLKFHYNHSNNEAKTRAKEYLSLVNLDEKLFNKFPKQLSGGERQRVVIAAAISLSPKILICDECVSALDSSTRFSILNLLTDLKNNLNFSLIFISHNLPVVKSISDKIIVLKNGKIIENKLNSNLIKSKNEYVKKLLKSSF